jgi:peptidoglycan/xylan/chitin deacetylase (PgdA/CDA1 family)
MSNPNPVNRKMLTAVVLAALVTATFVFYDLQLQPAINQALPVPENYYYNLHVPQKGERVVCIVFDDGWQTQYTNGLPILDQYGFKATFAIITSYPDKLKSYMGWNEIITLQKQGHDIESHTVDHPVLTRQDNATISYQLQQSQADLLKYGINAPLFVYPEGEGAGNATVESCVQQYYLAGRGINGKCLNMRQPFDRYALPGFTIGSATTVQQFKDYVNQADNSTIAIVYYHRISNEPVSTAITPDNFAAEMQYLHDNGFTVKTMKELFTSTTP